MGMTIACPKCGRKLVWSMLFRWLQCEKLLNAKGRECDPYNIPDDFIATTMAIHLGKRIA